VKSRFYALLRKEFLEFSRDKALIFILLWAFTGAIFTAGHGINLEVKNYPTVIMDLDNSPKSRELISRLHKPYFKILGYLKNEKELIYALDSGRASLAVVIPTDFQRKIDDASSSSKVQIIVDGTISMSATIAISYIAQIVNTYSLELLEKKKNDLFYKVTTLPTIDERVRVEFNPNILSSWFSSLLELLNMFTMVSMLLAAAALVREKEYGTIEQLMVTPATVSEIFFSKILVNLVIILLFSFISIFLILKPVFGVPIRGSLLLFYIVAALYVFTIESLGIAIAIIANNLSQTIMLVLLVLAPMLFLSGAWTPPEAMAKWMQYLSLISPMRYFIDFGYSVLFKGNGLSYVWFDILGILIIGGSLFTFSLIWFTKKLSK
jgi:ABC-2 type transport system permease protein